MTGSGKTFAAWQHAAIKRTLGFNTLVLSKPGEVWPTAAATWQTQNPAEFLRVFRSNRSCVCYIEIADGGVEKNDTEFHACFTNSAQLHQCFYLAQNRAQAHPGIRASCNELFLFKVDFEEADKWAKKFGEPVFLRGIEIDGKKYPPATHLDKRWFYWKKDHFTPTGPPRILTPPKK